MDQFISVVYLITFLINSCMTLLYRLFLELCVLIGFYIVIRSGVCYLRYYCSQFTYIAFKGCLMKEDLVIANSLMAGVSII